MIDDDVRKRFETRGKLPVAVLKVEPEEVFIHCSKAFMRSKLWEPDTWPDRSVIPPLYEMIKDHAKLDMPWSNAQDMEDAMAKSLY